LAQYDINLREYWRILKKRKFVVILITIVLGLFSIFFAILRAPEPLYTSVCSIKFEKETTLEGLYAKTISWSGGDDIETQITVIKSYPVFERVAESLRLIHAKRKKDNTLSQNTVSIVDKLQSKVEVTREEFTNIFHIKVTDRNPVFAQRLANTIALTYKELHSEEQMKRTKEALKYISDQLREVREKLRKSEEEFNRFTQKNELLSIDLQSEGLLTRAREIQDETRKLQANKREFEGILRRLNHFVENPSGSDHDFYSSKANTRYQNTNDILVGLLLKRDTLLKAFTPRHPEVVAIRNQILENARKMGILLQLQIDEIEKQGIDLKGELEKVDSKTKVLMDKKLEYDRLKRRVDSYNDMTALLERKNQEALIRKAEKPEEVTIVKPALLPSQPINPPKTVATGAMGILIGLVLGIVIGFTVETFDTSLGAIEDVEETLGTQVLGIIPQADAKDIRESLKEKHPEKVKGHTIEQAVNLISHLVPKSMMAESFRALRTNIEFKEAEKEIKTLVVASTSPEEGKTLVAMNLAMTMAQAGTKVLLVGSDLRKPTIDKAFGVEMTPGLSDILMGNYPWRDTVKTVTDIIMGQMSPDEVMMTPGLDNLHIITSGPIPPNPAELMDSKRFIDFLQEAREEYDMIIFDSSPVLSTADAAILGANADGVLLVYRVGAVSRGLLRRSTAQLRQVQSNLVGVVLNGMRPDVSPDFQDYKYYSYYYAYGEEEKGRKSRKRKKGFSFLKVRGDKQEKEEQKPSLQEEGERAPEREERRGDTLEREVRKLSAPDMAESVPKSREGKSRRGRFALLLLAVVVLGGALLWQNGIIALPEKWHLGSRVKKDEVKPAAKKEPVKKTIPSRSKPFSTKPKPMVRTEKDRPQVKAPATKPKAVKKQVVVLNKPLAKKAPSELSTQSKKMAIKPKPKPTIKPPARKKEESKPKEPETRVIVKKPEPQPQSRVTVVKPEQKPQTRVTVKKPEPKPQRLASVPKSAPVTVIKPPPSPKKVVAYPYSLYLGSFRTLKLAKRAVSIYKGKDLSPYWVKVSLRKGIWYRVYVGAFEDPEKADRFKREHGLREAALRKTRYANLIGRYSSPDELEDKMVALKRLDFSPYVIRDQNGKFQLLVGAFITKEGVEKENRELKSNGIQSRVVKR
jgi:capsular exopolysaccharide synthesis family protein